MIKIQLTYVYRAKRTIANIHCIPIISANSPGVVLRAYAEKEYTEISKTNAALSLAAILYFLSPIDLLPDFLAIGLIDDLAVLTWVYFNFQSEIEGFLEWEDENKLMRIEIKGLEDIETED